MLFYGTNALVSLRYGRGLADVLPWAVVMVPCSALLIPLGTVLPASALLGCAVVLLVLVTTYVEVRHRSAAARLRR